VMPFTKRLDYRLRVVDDMMAMRCILRAAGEIASRWLRHFVRGPSDERSRPSALWMRKHFVLRARRQFGGLGVGHCSADYLGA
jgi:hypothetical protein